MRRTLEKISVAILVCDGFEEAELTKPMKALLGAGAAVKIISPNEGTVKAWHKDRWSESYPVDMSVETAKPKCYDALLLPGGVMNPDKLRALPKAVNFVSHFIKADKPIAAICHGPWTLIETGKIKGRKLTSYHSIKTDLKNAGAKWQDREVVTDGFLVTSRSPEDLPAFTKKMIEVFAKYAKKKSQIP